MLDVREIYTYYGRSNVLQGVSLSVQTGEVVTLLGRNGAGKTTTLRSIVGLTPARRGQVMFDGRDVTHRPAFAIARAGVAFVPSGRRIFSDLTVRQNLLLSVRVDRAQARPWTIDRIYDIFPKLRELDSRKAGFLSGGEQQMLKLARALVANPKLLLLDELTEGLAPAIVVQLGHWLRLLKEEGMSMLLCEQNALFALRLADRGYILEKGRIQHAASSDALRDSPEIRQYLGV